MTEKEYIEREAALSGLDELEKTSYHNSVLWPDHVEECREALRSIPAADVRTVVRGKWVTPTVIGGRPFNIPHCSACNGVPCGVDEHTNFCPNCGAMMEER